jgi:predicted transglutaminase-like cysteine proteinase
VTPLPPICGWKPVEVDRIAAKWDIGRGPLLRAPFYPHQLGLSDSRPQLDQVQAWVNEHVSYKTDPKDHWQTASETLGLRSGDCEDYAILKHRILRAQGVPDDDLLLLVAFDAVARMDHAMLLAAAATSWWCLDHRTPRVLPLAALTDYRPIVAYQNARTFTFPARA